MNLHVTPRETQIMELLSFGNSQKEIADILGCSINTVDTHIKNIKEKTGLQKANEIGCAYLFKRYHLPISDICERTRKRIAIALLALSLFSIFMHTTDFFRVLRPTTRATSRTGAKRGRKDDAFYLKTA
ncbi:MAG: helix-turn-helix transcriptional regulator [Desulfobulbaceae bacterium]|nr:helix-turn-helix transcriptional regulator [Desulfobulbaceae bacterium]